MGITIDGDVIKKKSKTSLTKKMLLCPLFVGSLYFFGSFLVAGNEVGKASEFTQELNYLNQEKSELVERIEDYNEFLPKLASPFFDQYGDSLASALIDTSRINSKIDSLKKEYEQNKLSPWGSWYTLIIKDTK